MRDEAEITRLRYKYRNLIMRGRIFLPPRDAAKLIGPDCAFHLYRKIGTAGVTPKKGELS
jgi:hypothetical protein